MKLWIFVDFHRFYPFKFTYKETQKPQTYSTIEVVNFAFPTLKSKSGPPSGQPAYSRTSFGPPKSNQPSADPHSALRMPIPVAPSASTVFGSFLPHFPPPHKNRLRPHTATHPPIPKTTQTHFYGPLEPFRTAGCLLGGPGHAAM